MLHDRTRLHIYNKEKNIYNGILFVVVEDIHSMLS